MFVQNNKTVNWFISASVEEIQREFDVNRLRLQELIFEMEHVKLVAAQMLSKIFVSIPFLPSRTMYGILLTAIESESYSPFLEN